MNQQIPNRESETTEFKTSFTDEVITTLVAFSNTKGGSVYVGVSDKGEVKGIQTGPETIQAWINEIKNKTNPALIPDVELRLIHDKTIAIFHIDEYPIKPVSSKGRYYKRVLNSNHLMNIDELANEHLKTINSSWDYYPDPNHGMESISIEKVKRYIRSVELQKQSKVDLDPQQFLEKMEIVRKGLLTFGGYLMFANDYCSISDVQVGRFKSSSIIIDSISLSSDLFGEVEDIMAFIKKHLMVEIIITGEPMHTERFDYPLDAIREIVQNMVLHRDYRDSSASIIKIFDDRMEFFNPGTLYGGITIENLISGNYSSKTRNKLIAKVFKESGLIEQYGSGIMRVRRICREYGLHEPLFQEMQQGFKVTLYKETTTASDYEKVGEKVGERVGEKVGEKLTQNQQQILSLIAENNYITTSELAQKIQISNRKIEENIAKLKQKGMLRRIGPARGGHWQLPE